MDTGTGVFVMRPGSGRNVSHDLNDSFLKALQAHRDELLREMPTLCDDLKKLYGVFAKSRYLYEAGGSLPHSTAKNVSQLLAEKTANLPSHPSS
jgi:hypothetical protein